MLTYTLRTLLVSWLPLHLKEFKGIRRPLESDRPGYLRCSAERAERRKHGREQLTSRHQLRDSDARPDRVRSATIKY